MGGTQAWSASGNCAQVGAEDPIHETFVRVSRPRSDIENLSVLWSTITSPWVHPRRFVVIERAEFRSMVTRSCCQRKSGRCAGCQCLRRRRFAANLSGDRLVARAETVTGPERSLEPTPADPSRSGTAVALADVIDLTTQEHNTDIQDDVSSEPPCSFAASTLGDETRVDPATGPTDRRPARIRYWATVQRSCRIRGRSGAARMLVAVMLRARTSR